VGLAALDTWDQTRKAYYEVARRYLEVFKDSALTFQKKWGEDWVSSTCVVKFTDSNMKKFSYNRMKDLHIQTRDWWNQGCHREFAFEPYNFLNIAGNTALLAKTSMGLPFFRFLTADHVKKIHLCQNT
jgi:dTDP-4-amino-4,6-dideoxygalactose transaminase